MILDRIQAKSDQWGNAIVCETGLQSDVDMCPDD